MVISQNKTNIDKSADIYTDINKYLNSDLSQMYKLKLFFLRNYTIEPIVPFIQYHLFSNNINPSIEFGNYNNYYQEIIDNNSNLYTGDTPDIIILSLILENFDSKYNTYNWSGKETIARLKSLYELLKSKTSSLNIINTFIHPYFSEIGISNTKDINNPIYQVAEINAFIREYVKINDDRFFLVDFDNIARILGEEKTYDYRFWYSSKLPFKKDFLYLFSFEIAKIVKALKGKSKKCLVLDCDNTLWGGIIGEDGINNIKLNPNDYPGNAFYDFQKNILKLYNKGVLLAINSKNNAEDIWNVLNNHPHSILKKEHFAVWRINWQNKAKNISEIANELNIGIDSLVFVDDDPMECDLVKESHPEVYVLKVPKNIYNLPNLVLKDGLFDTLSLNSMDSQRTKLYITERKRSKEQKKYSNIDKFLKSLKINTLIHKAEESEIPRIAQLTQKTNQFNLTTIRYSEVDITNYIKKSDSEVYTLTASDKYGNLGLTGVLIAKIRKNTCYFNTLLMSCRILGRKLEYSFVSYCIEDIRKNYNIKKWEASYIKTQKNKQVLNFWKKFNFFVKSEKEGAKYYQVDNSEIKTIFYKYVSINK
jgi:FkbH-like protein